MARGFRVAGIFVTLIGGCDAKPEATPPYERGGEITPACGSPGDVVRVRMPRIDACKDVWVEFDRYEEGSTIFEWYKTVDGTYKQHPTDGIEIIVRVPELPPPTRPVRPTLMVQGGCSAPEIDGKVINGQEYTKGLSFTIPCPDAGIDTGADTSVTDTAVDDTGAMDTLEASVDSAMDDSTVVDTAPMDTAGEEICDGIDNDGDGAIDEGCPTGFNEIDYWGKSPTWGYTGTVSGSSGFSGLCAYPRAIVGMCGRVDSKGLIALGNKCAQISLATDKTVTPYKYSQTAPTLGACSSTGMAGSSSGGTIFDYDCPPNMVVQRVLGQAGSSMPTDRIGQIQFECVRYGLVRNAGNIWKVIKESTAMSPVYGTGPGTTFDWTPPDHTSGNPAFLNAIAGYYTLGTDARIFLLGATGRSFTLMTK